METHRLRVRRVDSVGMVGKGDDPESGFVFWKRREDAPLPKESEMPFDPKTLTGEARTAWDALEKRATDAAADVTKITARVADLEKQLPKPADKDVLTGISPEAKAQFEKQSADLRLAQDRIQKMEEAAARERYIAKAAVLKHLPGAKPDDLAPVWQKIDGALDATERERFGKWLGSWNEQLRESALFKELGDGGPGPSGSVEDEVTKAAADIQKAKPALSSAQARAEVWTTRPELYNRYQEERRALLRTHGVEG